MKNNDLNNLDDAFLTEVSEMAKNRKSSEGFLSDLVNLANSDEYADFDFSGELEEEIKTEEIPSMAWNNSLMEDEPGSDDARAAEQALFDAEKALKEAEAELKEAEAASKSFGEEDVSLNDNNGLNHAGSPEEDESSEESEETPVKKKKKNSLSYYIAMAVCLGVFFYCVGRLGYYFYTGYTYRKDMDKLSQVVGDISADVVIKEPETPEIYFPDEQVYVASSANYVDEISDDWKNKYASLVEMNPDCVGWIKIPDTNINYPVMYTPGDYEYYLRRDFEKNHLMRGLPFLADGTKLNVSQNTVIYGHNMNDGTAFGNLRNYVDQSYAEAHKYCYFYTAYNQGVYELMDVVITKIYNVEDTCFKYYMYADELDQERFETYVYYMKKMSKFDTGVDAVWGDKLISLSTCYKRYDKENGRLVLVFKRIQ